MRQQILLVVPVHSVVYPKCLGNFLAMAFSSASVADRYQFSVHVPERKLIHGAMNEAAEIVLDPRGNFDAMIVCDDDCFPPFDAIPKLLTHYEAGHPFVAGLGFMRGYPHTTTIGRYFPEGMSLSLGKDGRPSLAGFEWVEDVDHEPNDLVRADFCGFPIAMVSKEAFRKMEAPYFGTFIDGGGCTHDVYFGVKAKRAGISILVDRTIECGHLAEAPVLTVQNRMQVRDAYKALVNA